MGNLSSIDYPNYKGAPRTNVFGTHRKISTLLLIANWSSSSSPNFTEAHYNLKEQTFLSLPEFPGTHGIHCGSKHSMVPWRGSKDLKFVFLSLWVLIKGTLKLLEHLEDSEARWACV